MAQPKYLTEQHKADIEEALRMLYDAQNLLAKMEACGRDCQAKRREMQRIADKLEKMHREFFS